MAADSDSSVDNEQPVLATKRTNKRRRNKVADDDDENDAGHTSDSAAATSTSTNPTTPPGKPTGANSTSNLSPVEYSAESSTSDLPAAPKSSTKASTKPASKASPSKPSKAAATATANSSYSMKNFFAGKDGKVQPKTKPAATKSANTITSMFGNGKTSSSEKENTSGHSNAAATADAAADNVRVTKPASIKADEAEEKESRMQVEETGAAETTTSTSPTANSSAKPMALASKSKAKASPKSAKSKAQPDKAAAGRKKRKVIKDDDDDADEAVAAADEPAADSTAKPAAAADEDDEEGEDDGSDAAKSLLMSVTSEEHIDSEDSDPYQWGSAKFDPIANAPWSKIKVADKKSNTEICQVPYAVLTEVMSRVEEESGRLRMIAIVSDFLRSVIAVSKQDLLACVYLMVNAVAPAYAGIEIGVGEGTIKTALAQSIGGKTQRINELMQKHGDIGLVALECRQKQTTLYKPKALMVSQVFTALSDMARMSGKNSMKERIGKISGLLVACNGNEAKYIARSLTGNLRIGLAEKTIIAALARAVVLGDKYRPASQLEKLTSALEHAHAALNQAYIEVPSHEVVIPALLDHGIDDLPQHCYLQPGVPIRCMLGKPTTGVAAIIEKFGEKLFTVEYKYDGERAQVHLLKDGSIQVYSRNSENNTVKFPDVIRLLPHAYEHHTDDNKVIDFIIDCEVVAWDVVKQKILPFQILTHRKRKDVQESDIQVQVCLFAFDLLYLNGKSYINEPLLARRQKLFDTFNEVPNEFKFVIHRDTNDLNEIDEFLQLAVKNQCEGLMVKSLEVDATYVPAKRNWLKIKKDYLAGIGDTLDLVVIGAFYGKGKRTGVYGAFLLACYDDENEEYQAITKLGTGFGEDMLEQLANSCNEHIVESPDRSVRYPTDSKLQPDVYFAPKLVWEVLVADLSLSPVYLAAIGKSHPEKGIALRFPRFIRVRDDKKSDDATSANQVHEMFEDQENRK